jgi:hypothetical protein
MDFAQSISFPLPFLMLSSGMTNLPMAAIMIVFAGGPHTPERTALACELLVSRPPPALIYLTGAEYQGEYSNLTAQVRAIAATLPTHPEVRTDNCRTTWESCRHLAREMQTIDRRLQTIDFGEEDTPHLNPLPQGERKDGNQEGMPLHPRHLHPLPLRERKDGNQEGMPLHPRHLHPLPLRERAGVRGSLHGSNVYSLRSMVYSTVITSDYHAPRVRWLLGGADAQLLGSWVLELLRTKSPTGFHLTTYQRDNLATLPSGTTEQLDNLTTQQPSLTVLTTPDIPWRKAFATPRNRQLIWGECVSWLYCGPLGLLYRPWWLLGVAGMGFLLAAGLWWRKVKNSKLRVQS